MPSGDIPGWYCMGILGYLVFKDWGVQADTCIPGWYWVSQDTKYSRIGVFRQTCHLGTSQDGTGYPGILSIQGLGCSGRPSLWGHPGWLLGILGY